MTASPQRPSPSAAPPTPPRDWVSFDDETGTTWMFDATFLASRWTCIYGAGCQGVLSEDTSELEQGCCSYGAHFADKADRANVKAAAQRLTAEDWQFIGEVPASGPIHRNDEGDWVTRQHDDACIFLNRPGFDGGAGCALHRAALRHGERPLDWKPDVCWQLPLRLTTEEDEVGHTTYTLREWKRRDWGDGGAEFHWWCTEGPEAFVGRTRVIDELHDEIVELVGDEPARWITEHLDQRPATQILPHPARRGGRAKRSR